MLQKLPTHLLERSRLVSPQQSDLDPSGVFVMYWMRTAVRIDENPALDVARSLANQLQRPLLIYHALSEHYEFASDRHHTFMLEGAADVQRQAAEAGLAYAFHLATPADRRCHLVDLAKSAAVVVTEDMPVDPPRRFLRRLIARVTTPVVAVDTACILPMQKVGQAYTRAFQYQEAFWPQYLERISQQWPIFDAEVLAYPLDSLPFEPVDFQRSDISELVATCEIDHAIGPIRDTIGGSRAGYRRWTSFLERGLKGYAKSRNNPLLDGVSRMSPYLHYGMVSPLRLAREAGQERHAGAEKFLDELLIWRELAYAFCFYREDHDQWSAIPEWARQTLTQHVGDRRHRCYTWEELARAETGDAFWDAAQKSLLMHGELHNNIRMTWGKAILNWCETPQAALKMILDLNHRYALDGRDPASFGGILWCLGQFDRPFEPEQPILGTVRPRPTAEHARRLNPQKYEQLLRKRVQPAPARIAVIGAGISGLMAARTLADHGHDVTVFEKSRGVGGRMATRRLESGAGMDHGAQYFTIRDLRLRRYADSWLAQGLMARWPDENLGHDQRLAVLNRGTILSFAEDAERFVGIPSMNAICKHLANGLRLVLQTRIIQISRESAGWILTDEQGPRDDRFDYLVISSPAEQTADLLDGVSYLSQSARRCKMNPCWAVMLELSRKLTNDWVGAFVQDSPISWIARNGTKPGRNSDTEQVIVHANPVWTSEHWETAPDWVVSQLTAELWKAAGIEPQLPLSATGHRWKYALAEDSSDIQGTLDSEKGIALCGDWTRGPRVEGAFLSGMAAAGRILGMLPKVSENQPRQLTLFS
jgi:photolyase PhrII